MMRGLTRRQLLRSALSWTVAAAGSQLRSIRAIETFAADISERERAAMTRIAEAFRTQFGIPGLAVAIARHGQSVYDEAFGVANRERGEALTSSHQFRIASVSKPITSCAIFDLIETRQLSLDDRVFGRGGLLGTRFGRQPYGRFVEDITVEHLLTHTCGGWRNDGSDPMFSHPAMSHGELISWTLNTLPIANVPGRAYAYSNFGFCLLGRIIETVTGQSYQQHVASRILRRCGVQDMSVAANTESERHSREVSYYGQSGENPYGMNVRRMDSHGGWIGTARDLAAFAMHLDGRWTRARLLGAPTIATMTSSSTANRNYAKGWAVNQVGNWWHNGSLPGTTSIVVRTSSGLCWSALANSRRPGTPDVNRALDDMVWEMVRQVGDWRG